MKILRLMILGLVLLLLQLITLAVAGVAAAEKATPLLCGKLPHMTTDVKNCTKQKDDGSGSSFMNFEVVLLPFVGLAGQDNPLWLHVHVMVSDIDDYFKNIAIMAQNIFGYPIGQWTVDIPCELHSGTNTGSSSSAINHTIFSLDQYRLAKDVASSMKTVDCPRTKFESTVTPNMLSIEFKPYPTKIQLVHAAVKLTKMERINVEKWDATPSGSGNAGIQFVVTAQNGRTLSDCYVNHFSGFYIGYSKNYRSCEHVKNYNVPVECHRCEKTLNIIQRLSAADLANVARKDLINHSPAYLNEIKANNAPPKDLVEPHFPDAYRDKIRKFISTDMPTTITSTTTKKPKVTTTTTDSLSHNTSYTSSITNSTSPTRSPTTITRPTSSITSPTSSITSPTSFTTTSISSTTRTKPTRTKPTRSKTRKPRFPRFTTTTISTTTAKSKTKGPKPDQSKKTHRPGSSCTKFPCIEDNTAMVIPEIPKGNMYKECERTKGCIGQPPGCIATRTCSSIVSYVEETNKAAFQLFGKSEKYIAMGFSNDQHMGHDSVIECVRETGNIIRAYRSFNLLNKDNKRLKDHTAISRLRGKYEKGEIYCDFLLDEKTTVYSEGENFTFHLGQEKYFILYVLGDIARDGLDGNIGYHSDAIVGEFKIGLLEVVGKKPLRILFEKIHGVTMIIVWFLVYPVGIFLPRYYKETWINRYIGRFCWWFLLHMVLHGFTVFFTVATTISLSIIIHGWRAKPWDMSFHMACGYVINVLLIIDVFLGYVVVRFNSPFRYYSINFIHGFIGHVLFFLSFVLIFESRYFTSGMPCISTELMITYMVVTMILQVVMNYQVCYTDFVQGKLTSRVYYSCGTLDLTGKNIEKDAPGAMCRKVMFVIFLVFCLVFTLALCVMYGPTIFLDCLESERIINAERDIALRERRRGQSNIKV